MRRPSIPENPGVFWTFQAFDDDQSALDFNTWGVQATQLAVTNFTSDTSNQGPEAFDIPVTLTATTEGGNPSTLVASGSPVVVTATIAPQTTTTTIYLAFGDGIGESAVGDVNYVVTPELNASFVDRAPVELIIPAGETQGTVLITNTTFNDNSIFFGNSSQSQTLTVRVAETDGINLGPASGLSNTLNLTVGTPTVSLENAVGYETQTTVDVPVRLSAGLPDGGTLTYETLNGTPGNGTTGRHVRIAV